MPAAALVIALVVLLARSEAGSAPPPISPNPATDAPPSAASLRRWHDLLGGEPHVAGTPGDARQIERLRSAFAEMGLSVEVQELHPLLPQPRSAVLEIVGAALPPTGDAPTGAAPSGAAPSGGATSVGAPSGRRGVIGLDLRERNLVTDPSTAHPDLSWGWNAYSASGDVTAPVVYANRATRADFAALRAAGIDCAGRIVLARYGGNFRGDKVRFAEEEGAAGLVIFSDPADVARGPTWPDGGWANDTCIQRGSILKKAQPGDPLTPGIAATADAPRLAIDDADLPAIPVQPIGFGAAGRILAAMDATPPGVAAPPAAPHAWQGGLPVTHRLRGPDDLRLRLHVEQERTLAATANVIATLPGSGDEFVVVGCHHDAWGFGAADPLAGTIVLMETARALADEARRGWRPRRSIVFAAWAAEEYGIIGSTEWCEQNTETIARHCVAYINLDMASMGVNVGAKASPLLFAAIRAAAAGTPQAREPSRTALEAWTARSPTGTAAPGLIDGGSDHEAFQFNLGVPSATLFASGSAGTSYHSNYDTLTWYRSVVGEDYEPALMVTRLCAALVRSLADEAVPPLDPRDMAAALRTAVAELDAFAQSLCVPLPRRVLDATVARFAEAADRAMESGRAGANGPAEAAWLMPVSPRWHRHALYGPNPDAGYSVETLPALRAAVRTGDPATIDTAIVEFAERVDDAMARMGG